MDDALRWYLALMLVGAAGLLPAALLFGRLRSAGVLFARPLALFAIAYVAWTASALGLAPYGTALVIACLLGLFAWSAWIAWRRPALVSALRGRASLLAAGEVLFLALFALVLLARAQAPAAANTEKPMDLLMLTAVHQAGQMPPPDPWLAGHDISYYHLGHVAVDVVGQLSDNPPPIAFNLGVATAGGLAGAAAFAVAGDLLALGGVRRRAGAWVAGGLAVASLLWLATLEGAVDLAASNGLGGEGLWGRLGVEGLPGPVETTHAVPDQFWWWWRATRVIPDTISEFPAFSLLLGDLHAHLLALPLGLVTLGLAVAAFQGGEPLTWRRWFTDPARLVLAGGLFATLGMTNSWDVLTFGGVWGLAAVASFLRVGWSPLPALIGAVRYLAPPAGVALLLGAPFLSTLDRPPLGIAAVTGEGSDPARFLLVWLTPALPLIVAALLLRPRLDRRSASIALGVAVVPLVAWVLTVLRAEPGELVDRGAGWLVIVTLTLALAGAWGAATSADRRGDRALAAAFGLAGVALAILLAAELFRIDDAFPGRLNTVFKFWFHAWVLLAVSGAAALALALDRAPIQAPAWPGAQAVTLGALALAGGLYLASMLYAPAMAVSRAREGQTRGIDALAYIEREDSGLRAAISWALVELDPRDDVIVQAVSESYRGGGMLSAATGVPTLLSWPNHQLQWRGPEVPFGPRTETVDAIYAGGVAAAEVARESGVTHVYVGRQEREAYGADVGARFAGWRVAFEAEEAVVLEVPTVGALTGAAVR
ncbi:MAG: hypothetical protein GEU80_16475 [Dehalococcoidia bacterium]|nr:hypothetical protein [Dehalococcoidia bacterium]